VAKRQEKGTTVVPAQVAADQVTKKKAPKKRLAPAVEQESNGQNYNRITIF